MIEASPPLHSQARSPSEKINGVFSRDPRPDLERLPISPRPKKRMPQTLLQVQIGQDEINPDPTKMSEPCAILGQQSR